MYFATPDDHHHRLDDHRIPILTKFANFILSSVPSPIHIKPTFPAISSASTFSNMKRKQPITSHSMHFQSYWSLFLYPNRPGDLSHAPSHFIHVTHKTHSNTTSPKDTRKSHKHFQSVLRATKRLFQAASNNAQNPTGFPILSLALACSMLDVGRPNKFPHTNSNYTWLTKM